MAYFSERIRILRKEKGLSQNRLGVEMNIPRTTISSWEYDNRSPDLFTAIKLAEFFKVSLDYIAGLSDTRNPEDLKKITAAILNGFDSDANLRESINKLLISTELKKLLMQVQDYPEDKIRKIIQVLKIIEEP
ncbi:helix-turn-helix domain-containing protein [Pseudobacteroides cellulosolvens]|uniref:Transcriptional regulator, XRE family n=1 Tax=Pseudobacteroides cellulosolvens ATCC 35603 = DSM 2933 TaxID=398512 RepID=A0A0L6JGE1_9FIRM|nr:helix-turn-helix transcriptional regulator [Pseudobacteroides cellulosolvens]KNY24769.1 transcriptional regulator, XRE family [Pseudobacteroides cellulosolvens ATCC 35603 = DSM 2933]